MGFTTRSPGRTIRALSANIQIEWEFTLSAKDSASGTSRVAVAEAPAEPIPTLGRAGIVLALLLVSLLGLLALRRG